MKRFRSLPKLPPRDPAGHKGLYGRVLVVGGSVGMVGAPALAANAALRSGAGLVRIACPKPAQQTIAALAVCATSIPVRATAAGEMSAVALGRLRAEMKANDVLAIGPGLGSGSGIGKITIGLLASCKDRPAVVDADGLNALAASSRWWTRATGPIILTPHPGEMQRLLAGAGVRVGLADRQAAAVALARKTRQIVVLKGAGTVVTDGDQIYVNRTGNPGMATGGAGDVLTGILAGLLGQKLAPFEAAVLGVHVHGKAGDIAADDVGQLSLVATDLLDALPAALRAHQKPATR